MTYECRIQHLVRSQLRHSGRHVLIGGRRHSLPDSASPLIALRTKCVIAYTWLLFPKCRTRDCKWLSASIIVIVDRDRDRDLRTSNLDLSTGGVSVEGPASAPLQVSPLLSRSLPLLSAPLRSAPLLFRSSPLLSNQVPLNPEVGAGQSCLP